MNRVTLEMFLALRQPYPVSFKIKGISPHPRADERRDDDRHALASRGICQGRDHGRNRPISPRLDPACPPMTERRLMAGASPLERRLELAATLGTIAIIQEEIKAAAEGGAA